MKTVGLYYVYDNIGETSITQPIPAANDLIAAIGFRDSFISAKDSKYNYKALDLVCIGRLELNEDGKLRMDPGLMEEKVIKGSEIIEFIKEKSLALGIEDEFVEEEE